MSEWSMLPRDVLTKVISQSCTMCCIARSICKAWRQHAFSSPVAVHSTLASREEQSSLAAWLQQHCHPEAQCQQNDVQQVSFNLAAVSLRESQRDPHNALPHHTSGRTARNNAIQRQLQAELFSAGASAVHTSNHIQASAEAGQPSLSGESPALSSQATPSQPQKALAEVRYLTQQLSSLKLFIWSNLKVCAENGQYDLYRDGSSLRTALWYGLQTAQISHLTLGEFLSICFCEKLPFIQEMTPRLPDKTRLSGLANLQSLTLHLNMFEQQEMFQLGKSTGGMYSLHQLSQLTSLTLKVSEVMPSGGRHKQTVPAEKFLRCLPNSITSLALHNFRDRWRCFEDLSCKPNLINLDLALSSCILPSEASAWAQLRQLKLAGSNAWLVNGQPFQFSALTRLTELGLERCCFGVYSPRQLGNTHQYVYEPMQAPSSIVHLNICTRNIRTFIVSEPLPALQALVLPNSIEVLDAKSLLQSTSGLRVTYNTMNKAYHGEWWSNLEALETKCPCNVSLGVAGVYPEGLQVLSLRTECPEPVSVSTGAMPHQSKAYPHQAVPQPAEEEQASTGAQLSSAGRYPPGFVPARASQGRQKGKGRASKPLLQQPVASSVLPCLHKLELHITGSLKQLVLTGLPKLQHLKVCQTHPRSKPKVTVRCKALKLPASLLTFDLTVSTPELMVQHHLTVLGSLPELMSVGLHGPVRMDIPELCTSVKRLDLSNSCSVGRQAYGQLACMTHLQELLLPQPLPADDVQAQLLQRNLKRHHVQLHYSDANPFMPCSSGTCLHPTPESGDSSESIDAEALELLIREDAALMDTDVYGGMQMALLQDAAMHAAMHAAQEAPPWHAALNWINAAL